MGAGGDKLERKKRNKTNNKSCKNIKKKKTNKGTKCFLSNIIINKETPNSVGLEFSNSYQNTVHEIYKSIHKSILHKIHF